MNIMSHANMGVRIEKQSVCVWKIYSKNHTVMHTARKR